MTEEVIISFLKLYFYCINIYTFWEHSPIIKLRLIITHDELVIEFTTTIALQLYSLGQ